MTVNPEHRAAFENIFHGTDCACVGTVTEIANLVVRGLEQETIMTVAVRDLKAAWKKTFGELI